MVTCNPGTTIIKHKQFTIENNKWGNHNANNCIYLDGNTIGWKWNNNGGWTYPCVVVGTNFCDWSTTWKKFPIQWKNVNSWKVTVEWKYPTTPTGTWNLGFDIYFWDTSNCGADSHKKMNNMVWIQAGGGLKFTTGKTVTVDGKTYYLDDPKAKWPRHNFMLKGGPTGAGSFTVDLKKLLSTQSNLNGNWYLDGIFLGNENVENTVGQINITKYTMEINGETISTISGGTSPSPSPSTSPSPSPSTSPSPSPSTCKDGIYIEGIGCIKYIHILAVLVLILLLRR